MKRLFRYFFSLLRYRFKQKNKSIVDLKYLSAAPNTLIEGLNLFVRNPNKDKYLYIGDNSLVSGSFVFETTSGEITIGNNTFIGAVRWYYSVFLRNGLGVFPTKSLVQNIGFDGSGENCGADLVEIELYKDKPNLIKNVVIDLLKTGLVVNYLSPLQKKTSFSSRIKGLFSK